MKNILKLSISSGLLNYLHGITKGPYFSFLSVDKQARGLGIARSLFIQTEEELRKNNQKVYFFLQIIIKKKPKQN